MQYFRFYELRAKIRCLCCKFSCILSFFRQRLFHTPETCWSRMEQDLGWDQAFVPFCWSISKNHFNLWPLVQQLIFQIRCFRIPLLTRTKSRTAVTSSLQIVRNTVFSCFPAKHDQVGFWAESTTILSETQLLWKPKLTAFNSKIGVRPLSMSPIYSESV